jgi:hypothetical protein
MHALKAIEDAGPKNLAKVGAEAKGDEVGSKPSKSDKKARQTSHAPSLSTMQQVTPTSTVARREGGNNNGSVGLAAPMMTMPTSTTLVSNMLKSSS